MYDEILEAIPLTVPRCFSHNIREYQKAVNYYESKGEQEKAQYYKDAIQRERQEEQEWDSLSWWQKKRIEHQERKVEKLRQKEYYLIYGRKYW